MPILVALLVAVAAFFSYRLLEAWTPRSLLPAGLRAAGWGTLSLLLLNASCPGMRSVQRPLVLLDGSLSMLAAGGRWSEALAQARRRGEVRLVGPSPGDTTPSAGRSRLAGALAAARGAARPVVVVTDGEIEDADELSAESLQGPEIQLLPRRAVPDFALTRVAGATRVTPTDSLLFDLEVSASPSASSRRLELEAREGNRVWLRGAVQVDAGGQARTSLRGVVPAVPPGPHVLSLALLNAGDAEPRDDARLLVVTVVPTPGVVLLASPPSWESRFLLDALRSTAALPVRGYLETERGSWRRAGDLHAVSSTEVADAARRADLLVTLGSGIEAARVTRARARWSWPGAARLGLAGDWYVGLGASSPVTGAFAGLALDSFPPGTSVAELSASPADWVGLTAQASRRGTVRPVLLGRDSAGVRRLVTGIDGLWRWAFRGGSSEQGYRSLVAASVSWLLGGADTTTGKARLAQDVVQRGRPAIFQWNGDSRPEPLPVDWSSDSGATRRDTLRFDGTGRAELLLAPGVWRYRLGGGGQGLLAVEGYSDEWFPGRVALAARRGLAAGGAGRRPLRGWVWLFGLSVAAFAGEWFARRRMGLR